MEEILNRIDENTWIISDTHFWHKSILKFEECRLTEMIKDGYTEDQHEQWIIDNWNKVISEGDTVLHLGDFAFKKVEETIEKLNGNIIMVLGNHDGNKKHTKYDKLDIIDGFFWFNEGTINKVLYPDPMFSGFIKEFNGVKYLFSHYDIFTTDEWDMKNNKIAPRINFFKKLYEIYECDFNIHGHTHSLKSSTDKSLNVCFEQIGFKPVRLSTIIK